MHIRKWITIWEGLLFLAAGALASDQDLGSQLLVDQTRVGAIKTLIAQPKWDDVFWPTYSQLLSTKAATLAQEHLQNSDLYLSFYLQVLMRLDLTKTYKKDEEELKKTETAQKNLIREQTANLLSAFDKWPDFFWKALSGALVKAKSPLIQKDLLSAISKQSEWPQEFINQILTIYSTTEDSFLKQAIFGLLALRPDPSPINPKKTCNIVCNKLVAQSEKWVSENDFKFMNGFYLKPRQFLVALFFLRSSAICPGNDAIRDTIVSAFFRSVKLKGEPAKLFPQQESFAKNVQDMMAINPTYISLAEDTPATYARIYFILLAKEILKQKLAPSEKLGQELNFAILYQETFLAEAIIDHLGGKRSSGTWGSHLNLFITATALNAIVDTPSGFASSRLGIDPISKRAHHTFDQMKSALSRKIDDETSRYRGAPEKYALSYHGELSNDVTEGSARSATLLIGLMKLWSESSDSGYRERNMRFLTGTIESFEKSLFDLQMATLGNPQFHDFGRNGIGGHYYFANIATIAPYVAQEKKSFDRTYRRLHASLLAMIDADTGLFPRLFPRDNRQDAWIVENNALGGLALIPYASGCTK